MFGLLPQLNARVIAGINRMLSDSLNGQDNELLERNPVMVEVTDLQIRLMIHSRDNAICVEMLAADAAGEQQLEIVGTSVVLMQLALAQDAQQVIATRPGLRLAGDTAALYAWQKAITALKINWEAELHNQLGTLPAVVLIQTARRLKARAVELNKTLPADFHHALVTNDLAVPRCEYSNLAKDVQQLRLETDSLRRRIQQPGNKNRQRHV